MMQLCSEFSSNARHSVLSVMQRFIAAANNMDETILVPSLLRDVPLEDEEGDPQGSNFNNNNHHHPHPHPLLRGSEEPAGPGKQRDLYEHYLLLKSIRNDIEWGLRQRERAGAAGLLGVSVMQEEGEGGAGEADADLESQFRYHLRGLFAVLSKLTAQADLLTRRYKREIGGGAL
uniref:MID1 interacting protein 1, like n=1 Tax=Lepisosteus oculatus TaxID=7918 RepID=W5NLU3_LEPOC